MAKLSCFAGKRTSHFGLWLHAVVVGDKAFLSASGAETEVDARSHSIAARVERCNGIGIQRRAVGRVRGSLDGKKHRCYLLCDNKVHEIGGYLLGTCSNEPPQSFPMNSSSEPTGSRYWDGGSASDWCYSLLIRAFRPKLLAKPIARRPKKPRMLPHKPASAVET